MEEKSTSPFEGDILFTPFQLEYWKVHACLKSTRPDDHKQNALHISACTVWEFRERIETSPVLWDCHDALQSRETILLILLLEVINN